MNFNTVRIIPIAFVIGIGATGCDDPQTGHTRTRDPSSLKSHPKLTPQPADNRYRWLFSMSDLEIRITADRKIDLGLRSDGKPRLFTFEETESYLRQQKRKMLIVATVDPKLVATHEAAEAIFEFFNNAGYRRVILRSSTEEGFAVWFDSLPGFRVNDPMYSKAEFAAAAWLEEASDMSVELCEDLKLDINLGAVSPVGREPMPVALAATEAFFWQQRNKKLIILWIGKASSVSTEQIDKTVDFVHRMGYERVIVQWAMGDGYDFERDSFKE